MSKSVSLVQISKIKIKTYKKCILICSKLFTALKGEMRLASNRKFCQEKCLTLFLELISEMVIDKQQIGNAEYFGRIAV